MMNKGNMAWTAEIETETGKMSTVLERCYIYHTIEAPTINEGVVLDLANKLGVTIVCEAEDLPDPDEETLSFYDMRLYVYPVAGSDLKLVVGYDGSDHIACGRLHTRDYIEHANSVIKEYIDSPYSCPERCTQRAGEILGVFASPRCDRMDSAFFNQ